MIAKLLRKIGLGRVGAAVADQIATDALDKATGCVSSKVEDVVKARKAKRS